jgi:hypothetical protein
MNPYPFESLNHFTVPVAIEKHLLYQLTNGRWEAFADQILALWSTHRSRHMPETRSWTGLARGSPSF